MSKRLIWETPNLILFAPATPHIPREDGGHICITTKEHYNDRTCFDPKLAIEVMRLTMLSGEAYTAAMAEQGISIARINYQENGNWAFLRHYNTANTPPYFHIHLYGRTEHSKTQPFGEALYFPDPTEFDYHQFSLLTEEDITRIREHCSMLSETPKYDLKTWGLA